MTSDVLDFSGSGEDEKKDMDHQKSKMKIKINTEKPHYLEELFEIINAKKKMVA